MYVFTMFGQRPGSESLAVHANKEKVTRIVVEKLNFVGN